MVGQTFNMDQVLRCLLETTHTPRQFQSASFALFPGRGNGGCVLHELILGFVQPSCKSHGFPSSEGNLSLQCQSPGLGCSIYGSNCSLPREDVQAHVILLSSAFTPRYTGPTLITSFSALPEPMWIYLYSPGFTRVFLLVPSLFSGSLALHVDVFLMYLGQRCAQPAPTPPS